MADPRVMLPRSDLDEATKMLEQRFREYEAQVNAEGATPLTKDQWKWQMLSKELVGILRGPTAGSPQAEGAPATPVVVAASAPGVVVLSGDNSVPARSAAAHERAAPY